MDLFIRTSPTKIGTQLRPAARGYAHSEDGFSSGRPGEVEMQDMGAALPRRPSLPELANYAGERNGQCMAIAALAMPCSLGRLDPCRPSLSWQRAEY